MKTDARERTPLLSIVIPTRNRAGYARWSIESVLNLASPLVELVVEDNGDSDELADWLGDIIGADRRLVYNHSTVPATMSENYDRAVEHASGEYVCLIGDDDGVNPEIVGACLWAKENRLDALVPSNPAHFIWPDLQMHHSGAMPAGSVRVLPFSGSMSFPDGDAELLKCARDAGQEFHKLPKAYYGVVRRAILEEVKRETGTFFPGVSPDIAAAVAIANYARTTCHVDYPLFVPGSSATSNAGLSGLRRHIGWLRDQPHLPTSCERQWSEIVPAFYSVQTIWAESTVEALRATGRTDLLREFNVPRLHAYCFIFHRKYVTNWRLKFYRALRAVGRGELSGTMRFAYWWCYWWSLRARAIARRAVGSAPVNDAYNRGNVKNIDEAVKAVTEYLRGLGVTFDDVAKRNSVTSTTVSSMTIRSSER